MVGSHFREQDKNDMNHSSLRVVRVLENCLQYNPAGPAEDGEGLELFNQMGIKVDLSGWRFSGGIDFTFPSGTSINPGGYLVVRKSPAVGQLGPLVGSLDNGGESITLINQSGRLMDALDYGDLGRWPVAADGSGATLAKRDPYTANKPLENWTTSAQVGGTPGRVNFPPPPGKSRRRSGSTKCRRQARQSSGSSWSILARVR